MATSDMPRGSPLFTAIVLLTLALFALVGVILLQPALISGLLGHDIAAHVSQHFRLFHHRIHDLTFSLVIGTAVAGLAPQLWDPSRNAAGQVMALIPWAALAVAFALSGSWIRFAPAPIFATLTVFAAILHPTAGHVFRSTRTMRANRPMLALLAAAAVPLLALAFGNVALQRTVANDHATLGHYAFMAAFSFTVIAIGALASMRPAGWKLAAWTAGMLPLLLGVASLLFPALDSSLDLPWSLAAIGWGIAFIAAAFRKQAEESQPG